MVIIMTPEATQKNIEDVVSAIENVGLKTKITVGEQQKIVAVIGDKNRLSSVPLDAMDGVEQTEPRISSNSEHYQRCRNSNRRRKYRCHGWTMRR